MRRNCFLCMGIALLLFACGNEEQNQFVASGIIEGTTVKVPAQTGGLLLAMNVDEGEDVQLGQVVAVVDTEKLVYQLQQIESGLQELAVQRRINLNLLEKTQSDFKHIETKYNRFKELYEKNSASQQTIDDLKNAYDLAITQLENARQNLKIVEAKQGSLEAQGKLLQRQIADATIKAAAAGTVSTKYFEAGEMAAMGAPVVEIVDLQNMWTKVYVSELKLPKIKIGQPAEIRIDGTEQKLSGKVSWISPRAEFTPKNILTEESRTSLVYAVKVEVENPDHVLKHGMPVEIALTID